MLRRIGLLPIFMIVVLLTILGLNAVISVAKPGSTVGDRQVREMPHERPSNSLAGL